MKTTSCFKGPGRPRFLFLLWPSWLLLALLVMSWPLAGQAQGNDASELIPVVGSGNSALDRHIISLISDHLDGQVELDLMPAEDPELSSRHQPVITIGPSAFSRVRLQNRELPVLAVLVEEQFIAGYLDRSPGQIGAVYYDVPLLRQALTGKAILPRGRKVALLATTESAELYEPLVDQLPEFGLEARIFIADTEDRLIPTLNRALSYGDFLLAGPDHTIYNPRNIKPILLTAYRRNKILIGPSQSYVKAGSLASSYAPFPDMARQAADNLQAYLKSGQFPQAAYPDHYRVEVNEQVARSLNLPLPDRQRIADQVDQILLESQEGSQ